MSVSIVPTAPILSMYHLSEMPSISGVDSGMNLRVEGEGGESPGRGMRPGNLYVEIEVERDPYFIRKVRLSCVIF